MLEYEGQELEPTGNSRGPVWVTNPVDVPSRSRRLNADHDYQTAAKLGTFQYKAGVV